MTMRIAKGVERRSDPHGFRSRSSLDFTAKKSGVTELTTLFETVPDDACPDSTGQWSPRAWNKFQLWLAELEGKRVRFVAQSTSIRPWESLDGGREVSIDLEDLQIPICGIPVMFAVTGTQRIPVSSARELDDWFGVPQSARIPVEGTLEIVVVNQYRPYLSLRDVKISWK
ncbi:MAG: hypothetical protein H6812_10250 [Phycisphaeraceae bacterium]|nr:hypothetical protein [Phycisphaeraceae bacterium]